jgi:ribokinase
LESEFEHIDLIASCLRRAGRLGPICVLPDFFVDRFVRIESIDRLWEAIKEKSSKSGGGSIRGVLQSEAKGGNAVNMAYALGTLGARVKLLTIADSLPAATLESVFRPYPNVELKVVQGRAGYTLALEFQENDRHVNVMVSDSGDVQNFDGSQIDSGFLNEMKICKAVAVVNWGANHKGTELCSKVFSECRANLQGRILTFFDPADPIELMLKLPDLKRQVFDRELVDVMSLNDNEARTFCKVLGSFDLPFDYTLAELERASRLLSESLRTTVDLHTRNHSISCVGSDVTVADCHRVRQRTITGAGDIWDSADLIGYLGGLSAHDRLRLANATAGLYVSGESAEPPRIEEIIHFMRKDIH